ncbi:GGDEF domain-containing protein [Herpetosiphon llansteffanensis]|uniref:GGDEF domain-containing protein n=1 Tax=Herpetosiphon llansteffanensis TaxID=2094568 RepID=UPI000D7CFFC9|nr:GGDEF domain-containing protein [Herpetosiphon llansteffanensis]
MALDQPTVSLIVGIGLLLQACVIGAFLVFVRRYQGIRCFLLGTIGLGLGFLIQALLPASSLIATTASYIVLLSGLFGLSNGILRFIGANNSARIYGFSWLLVVGLLSASAWWWAAPSLIISLAMLMGSVGMAYTAIRVWFQRTIPYQSASRLLAIALGLKIALVVAGLSYGWYRYAWPSVASLQVGYSVLILLLSLLWTGGFGVMITQRLQCDLSALASVDVLTGLANRRAINDYLEQAMAKWRRNQQGFAVIMLDIDSFKQINDRYGHHAGDMVLRHIGLVLSEQVRINDLIGRWGGEEFLLIVDAATVQQASFLAERLRQAIQHQPTIWCEQAIQHTVSIGIAVCGWHGFNETQLLTAADLALYEAKETGKNRWVVYERHMLNQLETGVAINNEDLVFDVDSSIYA